jgi:putative Mg2+ transporter-C (MgtC) family protein
MYSFSEDTLKIILSLVLGALIGLEREYRSKAAGFRTITLISIGSTLFTIVSIKLGGVNNADRVAANIITGIGFIGAGVVFKDALNITGLTTATAIWATAALGMAIGAGDYKVAAEGLVAVLIVLSLFEYVQNWIDSIHQKRAYKIVFDKNAIESSAIEKELVVMGLRFVKRKEMKVSSELICFYDIYGSSVNIEKFNSFLLNEGHVKSFEC